ncbi:MAG: hypothetical protein A2103_00120 [Gammaproteobacteria bacterium GWF2_41_13]|nr:MAG: hypothetical protein A2103_00120 [Gammaproteobacteria bacterium GWF2_41_13]
MGIVVDTCIFAQTERAGVFPVLEEFKDDIYISSITVSELLVGAHRANTTERRTKRKVFVDAILTEIPILDFTAQLAKIHAEICAALLNKG